MFANRAWFESSGCGWCLKPVGWQGKAYWGAWSLIVALPTAILMLRGQWFETLVWLGFTAAVAVLEMRDLKRTTSPAEPQEDLLYITEHPVDRVTTDKYELERKSS